MGEIEGVLAVADPAADQQPVRPAALGHRWVGDLDQGPVIPAGAFGAGPGRDPLPGPGGQPPRQLDRRARADPGGYRVAPGHRQDIAEPAAGQLSAQDRVLAVHLSSHQHSLRSWHRRAGLVCYSPGAASASRLTAKLLAFHRYGAVPGPGGFLNGGLRRDWSMMLNSR